LVARFVRDEEVPGSSPGSPTILPVRFTARCPHRVMARVTDRTDGNET
jgi:hypothetical protein